MREMVSIKIDAAYFHPTREFYQAVKISQVKFQQIWQGYRQATNEEMAAVARHLRLTRDELIKFMQSRQLDLLEDLSGNENGLLDDASLKYIKIYANKIGRLYGHVGNLQ